MVGRAGLAALNTINALSESETGEEANLFRQTPQSDVSPSSVLATQLGPVAAAVYFEISAASVPEQLDGIAARLWQRFGAGDIAEAEAEFLSAAVEGRRPVSANRARAASAAFKPSTPLPRLGSRFPPRQRPRSPDRQASRDRRRRLGGSSCLPDTLRHHYTEGQRAVLCIIAGEVKARGVCDLPIDKIAALAGVCRTTVQTALQEARRLGHLKITSRPVVGRKNLTNLVEIASAEWRMWIKRGSPAHRLIGSKPANLVAPTKNPESYRGDVERDRLRSNGSARGTSGPVRASPVRGARCG
jgi:hypothetical protein